MLIRSSDAALVRAYRAETGVLWRARAVTDALLILLFALGVAAPLAYPVHAVPRRIAAHLLVLFWSLAALSFVVPYVADLVLSRAP